MSGWHPGFETTTKMPVCVSHAKKHFQNSSRLTNIWLHFIWHSVSRICIFIDNSKPANYEFQLLDIFPTQFCGEEKDQFWAISYSQCHKYSGGASAALFKVIFTGWSSSKLLDIPVWSVNGCWRREVSWIPSPRDHVPWIPSADLVSDSQCPSLSSLSAQLLIISIQLLLLVIPPEFILTNFDTDISSSHSGPFKKVSEMTPQNWNYHIFACFVSLLYLINVAG